MDAIDTKKAFLALVAIGFLQACSQTKTTSSVFPDTQSQSAACANQASENRFIVQWEDGRFTVESAESSKQFRNGFVEKNLTKIKHVDRDIKIQTEAQSSPDTESSSEMNWGPQLIEAPALWEKGIDGSGIVVAVIDGMVDVNHLQLHSNILVNTKEVPNNGIDDDNNGFVDDYLGVQINSELNDPKENKHGSHVSGIIAADPTEGPVHGVAPKAKILPAQFIANDGGGNIGDAILGMNYAVSRGAKILNLSWGGSPCSEIDSLKTALQKISDQGVLIVTAAGNGNRYGIGFDVDAYPVYPSSYNFANQLNVAATTIDDYLISFSNFGARSVHVGAPGVNIYSTTPGNKVESMSGTSMAAPMTSGSAALIWSAFPTATASQVKQALMRSVDIVPGRQIEVLSRGRINVSKAYNELKKLMSQ